MTNKKCAHKQVVVDYFHPHSDIHDVLVTDLKASNPSDTRPIMILANPRCLDCGKTLTEDELITRIQSGGDLYDERFEWFWKSHKYEV